MFALLGDIETAKARTGLRPPASPEFVWPPLLLPPSYDRHPLRFMAPDLLIIDDLRLRALKHDEPSDLYEVIRLRYERGATLITSNRALEELPSIFGDPLLSSAAMDRLLDDAHVIVIDGDSYRNPPPNKRQAKKSACRDKETQS